uniref:54k protein n=1 Tax=Pea early browning virus TaxID=12294 RepID=Q84697_PEBV|nr:putative [Pea early-browning virus]
MVNTEDCNLRLTDVTLKSGNWKDKFVEEKETCLVPVLRTAMPDKRKTTQLEGLLALQKRNQAAPDLQQNVHSTLLVEDTIKRLKEVVYDVEKIRSDPINNKAHMQKWWRNQSTAVQAKVMQDVRELHEIDFSSYMFMIKSDVKPKMDSTPQHEYSALQTVIYHEKLINSLFGPIFKEINERRLDAIHPHFVFNTRMTASDLNDRVRCLHPDADYDFIEVDLSKFDKSANRFHLQLQLEIYRMFGLDEWAAFLWEVSHSQPTVRDVQNGMTAYIWYQQKSGDADTYNANSDRTMCALLSELPLEKCVLMTYGGDDSLIVFPKGLKLVDPCEKLATKWNFECKIFKFLVPAFCGKFLIRVQDKLVFVPDPVKTVTKFGKKCIRDVQHLAEIYISLNDGNRLLSDANVLYALDCAVADRYRYGKSSIYALCALWKHIRSFTAYCTLFRQNGKELNPIDVDWEKAKAAVNQFYDW